MCPITSINQFLGLHPSRKNELNKLRKILLKTELKEEIKWDSPCYTLKGKNVVGINAFKSYVGLWFHQGVFLRDREKKLMSGGETTKGQRQWRFKNESEMEPEKIEKYILEAIENQKIGKEIGTEIRKLNMPDELEQAIKTDSYLKTAFKGLTAGRQREYADYIGQAKQDATRITRLQKSIPLIKSGIGLNDKPKIV